jgi:MFS transporter, PPP family, 3-phenylpropionic acid transporter
MAIMGGIGAFGPFLGLVLDRLGHSAAVIGGLLALVPLTRILSTPLWSLIADRYRIGTRILQAATLCTALVAVAVASGRLEPAGVGLALVVFAFVRAPIGPIIDGLTVRSLETAGVPTTRYGRIRLWGSVAFLGVAGAAALVADTVDMATAPIALAALAWGVGFLVLLRLPAGEAGPPVRLGPALRVLAGRKGLGLVVLSLPLHGLGLNAYDGWYALHVEQLGLASTWTGMALALGVSLEVGVMAVSARVLSRARPETLVAVGMAVAAVRWALTAVISDPLLLTLLQALHGVVFAVFWIGVVELFRRAAPPEVRASAQAVIMTACYGVGPLLTSTVGATLVDAHGTSALFGVASGAAALGAALSWVGGRRLRAAAG